jgi:hypothetical protein
MGGIFCLLTKERHALHEVIRPGIPKMAYKFPIHELEFVIFKRKRRALKEKYEYCVCPET